MVKLLRLEGLQGEVKSEGRKGPGLLLACKWEVSGENQA